MSSQLNPAEMGDEELNAAIQALLRERERREKKASPRNKDRLADANAKGARMCPSCGARMWRDGKRKDGVQAYVCPSCGKKASRSTGLCFDSSKLPPETIRQIVALIMLDCPMWVVGWIAKIDAKTAQYWMDRCLDAAMEWSAESKLSGRVYMDEMQFRPTRSPGQEKTMSGGVWANAYLGLAVDSSGRGFCKLYRKPWSPRSADVLSFLMGRVEPGSTIVHDGAKCHRQAIGELGLKDETAVFDPGGEAYERKMALLSNLCSYIRHSFEAHRGVKNSKIAAYANFFLYRWSHIRKAGLKDSIEYLFNRLSRTNKSKTYRESFKKD